MAGFVLLFITYLFIRSSSSDASSAPGFYKTTLSRVTNDRYSTSDSRNKIEPVGNSNGANTGLQDDDASSQGRTDRLREAEAQAKENANKKAPNRESIVGADDMDTAGSKKYRIGVSELDRTEPENPNVAIANGQNRNIRPVKVSPPQKNADEIEETNFASEILEDYLKMAPIVIFSKSYCPHSKRAKTILLEKYSILPRPYVVELDKEEHGTSIQALLAEITGRTTVPNVLVQGHSIGGGDEIAALDRNGGLAAKIAQMEQGLPKRITQVELNEDFEG